MAEPRVTKCKSCQAPIIWIKTASGNKSMPLDEAPILIELRASAIGEHEVRGFDLSGKIYRGVATEAGTQRESYETKQVFVRESHFASCPHSRLHRKPKND